MRNSTRMVAVKFKKGASIVAKILPRRRVGRASRRLAEDKHSYQFHGGQHAWGKSRDVHFQWSACHFNDIFPEENALNPISILCNTHAAKCIILIPKMGPQSSTQLILGPPSILRPANDTVSLLNMDSLAYRHELNHWMPNSRWSILHKVMTCAIALYVQNSAYSALHRK